MKIVNRKEIMSVLLCGGYVHEYSVGYDHKYDLVSCDERIVGRIRFDTWCWLNKQGLTRVKGKGTIGYSTYYILDFNN